MSEDLSEEEKQKKQTRERMRQEYYFAIKEEGNRTFLFLWGRRLNSLTLTGRGIVKLVDTFLLSWGQRLKSLTLIGLRESAHLVEHPTEKPGAILNRV